MPPTKWDLRVHYLAEDEILNLKRFYPHVLSELLTQLKLIGSLNDPRRHQHVEPMVASGVAEGWYRIALYKHNYRVIFRLLYRRTQDDKWLEVWEKDTVEDQGWFILEITRVGHRSKVYDHAPLYRRKKEVERSE